MLSLVGQSVKQTISRGFSTGLQLNAKVAVVLSGSGVYDGSEVHEASSCWTALSRAGAEVSFFAPDITQMHVVNHLKGEPNDQTRNVLEESARIARGNVTSLDQLDGSQFDAVIFPGGFGAAKNLSSFASDGPNMKVIPDVERILQDFHASKKPIGLCCISPVLAARVIPSVSLTVGSDDETNPRWPFAGAAGAIKAMGATHVNTDIHEVHVDEKNRVVTSAAYMCNTHIHEVVDNVAMMIGNVLKLLK